MNHWRVIITIWLLALSVVRADVDIGNETLQPFPLDASYAGTIATRPFNGSTQYLNPPIFSISPKVSFLGPPSGSVTTDPFFPEYQWIISTNQDLSNPLINERFISNMENRFDPFTNANGSIKSNIIYWAVGRIATNGTTNGWSATNSFSVHASATNRYHGMLRDATYLSSKATHPRLFFTPAVRDAAFQFYQTNDSYAWTFHLIHLDQFTNSGTTWPTSTVAWSTNGAQWPNNPGYPTNVSVNFSAFWEAVFRYGMTNESALRPLVVNQYSNLVIWIINTHYVFNDIGSGDGPVIFNLLTYGFDWLYNDLDATTRANAVTALERYTKWTMRSLQWGGAQGVDGPDTNYVLNSMQQMWFAMSEEGTSHNNIQFALASQAAAASYEHGTNSRAMFDAGLNWLIARGNFTAGWAAINQGRGYATVGNGIMIESLIAFDNIFPESEIWKAPISQNFPQWIYDMIPPGWREYHGAHGDGGNSGALFSTMVFRNFGKLLAHFSRNGDVMLAYTNSLIFSSPDVGEPLLQPQMHYLWPNVATPTTRVPAKVYLEDGFGIAADKPLNASDVFTNGIGFVLAGRPRASEGGHSTHCDGEVEIWAYGAKVTDSGSINLNGYGYLPDAHNQPKFDGAGNRTQYFYGDQPTLPFYSRILAYTNTDDFTYIAVDTSFSYSNRYDLDCGTNVIKCVRHVLLSKTGKYVVVYDDSQTWTNVEMDVNFTILEPSLTNLTATGFRYGTTNFAGQTISNHLFQVAAGFTITNMTGTNVTRNPVTGVYTLDLTAPLWNHHLWFRGVRTNRFHSMIVFAPQYPGSNAPAFTALDDNTVGVVFNGVAETNSFGTNYLDGPVTYRITTLDAATNPGNGGGEGGGGVSGNKAYAGTSTVGVKKK